MAKNKTSEWSTNESSNSDIAGENIAEGCSPANVNDAIRHMMAQIATARTGSDDGIVTGTVGADGSGAVWNVDGDLVEGSAPIPADAVGEAQIADDSVTLAKIAPAARSGDDTTLMTGTAGPASSLGEFNADGDVVAGPTYGTGANDLLQLDGSGALPAVDGSNLTGLNVSPGWELVSNFYTGTTETEFVTPDFSDGFEYMVWLEGPEPAGIGTYLRAEIYMETDAAYHPSPVRLAVANGTPHFGSVFLRWGRQDTAYKRVEATVTGQSSLNIGTDDFVLYPAEGTDDYRGHFTLNNAQKILRMRFTASDSGNISGGNAYLYRRPE